MRISELSARTQVSVHRLRRYEAAGLIASRRLPNGYRDYEEKTVRHVVFIAMSREMGFSLPFIAEYVPKFQSGQLTPQDMIEAIHQRVADIDQAIAEHKALRKKLIEHIAWFETRQRKLK
ncbi:MerR family transcriptional regulator [Limnohabitans sp. Rim28]|jgi:MerR family transcriptional regulator, copper efflux regulator|uniref:MerR family DNA-binding transcriptional regulator n=1 Tax=Limnohabitans sp. Rim28 TaxID=1100720 RepID=UPI0002E96822|nr:MerR family transcriptional regulator [Limnohabitans sp. Rim28]PVE07745.1 MerR family transcriptional regulator [Limnohabitans sp. Rim28]